MEYNIEPYLNATVSFSMARATTPLCNRTGVTWGTVTNHDANVCGNFKNENPVFAAVSKRKILNKSFHCLNIRPMERSARNCDYLS